MIDEITVEMAVQKWREGLLKAAHSPAGTSFTLDLGNMSAEERREVMDRIEKIVADGKPPIQ